jgi:hypothetical protein
MQAGLLGYLLAKSHLPDVRHRIPNAALRGVAGLDPDFRKFDGLRHVRVDSPQTHNKSSILARNVFRTPRQARPLASRPPCSRLESLASNAQAR